MISALAPALVALGACLAIMPWLRRESTIARSLMTGISFVLLVRYFAWRITQTLPPPGFTADFLVGYPFMLAEGASLLAACLSLLFLSRTIDRSARVDISVKRAAQPMPLVDVFVCTYNEEKAILERTIIGATGLEYGNYRVWVLDDGRRPWLERLTVRLGTRQLILRIDEVLWFGAEEKLVFAAVEGNRHYVHFTLDQLEKRLDPARFVRVHRAAIANLDWAAALRPGFAGTWRLQMRDAARSEVPVSRARARVLRERLGA